jgi:hypothetical protein
VVPALRERPVETCLVFQEVNKVEVAADLTPPLPQVHYESKRLLGGSSNEVTIGSGVQRGSHGQKHQYDQQGYGKELGTLVFVFGHCYVYL